MTLSLQTTIVDQRTSSSRHMELGRCWPSFQQRQQTLGTTCALVRDRSNFVFFRSLVSFLGLFLVRVHCCFDVAVLRCAQCCVHLAWCCKVRTRTHTLTEHTPPPHTHIHIHMTRAQASESPSTTATLLYRRCGMTIHQQQSRKTLEPCGHSSGHAAAVGRGASCRSCPLLIGVAATCSVRDLAMQQ